MSEFVSWLFSASALGTWEGIEGISIIIVLIGCWGEAWAEHRKFPGEPEGVAQMFDRGRWQARRDAWVRRWNKIFWRILLYGLVIELVSFGFVVKLSGLQIEGLRNNNFALEEKVETLRRANLKLRISTIPGRIFLTEPPNLQFRQDKYSFGGSFAADNGRLPSQFEFVVTVDSGKLWMVGCNNVEYSTKFSANRNRCGVKVTSLNLPNEFVLSVEASEPAVLTISGDSFLTNVVVKLHK